MIDLILLLLFNSLVCFGFYAATREGMVLSFIQLITPNWLAMPVHGCLTCMASVHSLYVFLPYALHHGVCLWAYLSYILALAGFNTLIMHIFNYPSDES